MESWHFWFEGRQALIEGLVERHVPREWGPLLDVGCGTGRPADRLRGRGHRVVALDARPEGPVRVGASGPALQGLATRLPFPDGAFGGVLLLDVLEHVDDRAALLEARRVLRPGGTALVAVPAVPGLWSERDRAAGHVRRYRRRNLIEALASAGLLAREVRYYQFLLFPLVAAARLAGRAGVDLQRLEERPGRSVNALLSRVNRWEVRMGDAVRWPWGSSLVAAAEAPDRV